MCANDETMSHTECWRSIRDLHQKWSPFLEASLLSPQTLEILSLTMAAAERPLKKLKETTPPSEQEYLTTEQPELSLVEMKFSPRPYRFPGKPSRTAAAIGGKWQDALQVYLKEDDDKGKSPLPPSLQDNVYYQDENCVVIYDGYPKARMHLLLLHRGLEKISTTERRQNSGKIRSIADLRRELHYPQIQKCHATTRKLIHHLTTEYHNLYQDSTSVEQSELFRMGYHAVPSMDDLHLHIISTDLDSPCLKNKKHYNSFTTSFFVNADQVEQELLQTGSIHPINVQKEEDKLKQPLRCFKCGQAQRNLPTLKQHLLQCSHPFNSSLAST